MNTLLAKFYSSDAKSMVSVRQLSDRRLEIICGASKLPKSHSLYS
jgi:hypothetical protein